jgi:hypothetical protein
MASTYTDLGIELMVTGENAGTWGDKTNTNLNLIEQLTGGVLSISIAGGAGNQDLTIANGATTGTAQQRVLEFTGTISGARVIRFPLLTENFYIIKNGTSGAHTVQLKAISGSGATVTFAAGDKGYKIVYLDGVATNTGVFDVSFSNFGAITATGNIVPGANDTYDLGASGNVWRNIYTGDLHLNNEHKKEGNIVDGSKGSWTLQEGAKDIYLINNKSNEKFRLKLEKIYRRFYGYYFKLRYNN